jgi:flagellar biosynthesis protein FlhB
MANDSSEEKTEQPSAKKLREARKKGQVPKSTDLSGALSILAGLLTLIALVPWIGSRLAILFLAVERTIVSVELNAALGVMVEGLKLIGLVSLVPTAVTAVVFTVSLWLQTGAVFSLDPSMPKLQNLNPVSGLKKLFSAKTLVQFVQMVLKTAIIGAAVVLVLLQILPDAIRVIHADVGAALEVVKTALMHVFIWCGSFFVLLGVVDLLFQRWQFMRDQRMSKTEVKRELKEDEGDQHIKAERKRGSQEPGFDEQLKYMRVASIVYMHSDGRLVVLAYRPRVHEMPLYVLRAKGEAAAQTLKAAQQHKVPTRIDDAVVEGLYPITQTGVPIPRRWANTVKVALRRAAA